MASLAPPPVVMQLELMFCFDEFVYVTQLSKPSVKLPSHFLIDDRNGVLRYCETALSRAYCRLCARATSANAAFSPPSYGQTPPNAKNLPNLNEFVVRKRYVRKKKDLFVLFFFDLC